MFRPSEKAYCQALLALRDRDFRRAKHWFDKAAQDHGEDQELALLKETTELLLAVKEELARQAARGEDELKIEEVFSNG